MSTGSALPGSAAADRLEKISEKRQESFFFAAKIAITLATILIASCPPQP